MKLKTSNIYNEPDDSRLVEDVELYKEFISESGEHLQETEANILALEENPQDFETLNSVFRCVHSIKGSAGFMGLEKIQKLSHELETILDMARKSELEINPSITNVLLSSLDTLGRLLDVLSIRVSRVTDVECEMLGKSDVEEDVDIKSSLDSIGSILTPDKDKSSGKAKKKTVKKKTTTAKKSKKKVQAEEIKSFNEPDDPRLVEDVELYKEFISESGEHLQETEANILSLEENPQDFETLNSVFRCVHSIKGSAGFMGLEKIQKLSHELETILDMARKSELEINPSITNVLLSSLDTLGRLLDVLSIRVSRVTGIECERLGKSDTEEDIDIKPSLDNIGSILHADTKNISSKEMEKADKYKEDNAKPEDIQPQDNSGVVEKIGAILVNDGVITEEQCDEAVTIKSKRIGEVLIEEGIVTKEQVEEAAQKRERRIGEILAENGVANEKDIEKAVKKQNVQKKDAAKTMLKVDTDKLDSLFDLVGELVVTHSLINEEFSSLQTNNNGTNQNLSQLGKIVKDLQDQTMSLRMLPLKQTFQKMSRLVRDIASSFGKKVKLEISGEDTELDKNVIEKVADPLVHILRNAVDHGIEPMEDRVKSNKPPEGHVNLNAFHRGGNIVIEIQDDGKGLSRDRILNKAIEKGIVNESASLSDEQVFNLIFAPGFSTAEKITNISGRGVGMDVVKKNIDNLQGKVDITSEEGKGSTFTIKLPLTLAIIDGIVVRVENTRYIIPIISVEESIRPDKEMLSTILKQEEILNIRGEVIPLVRLHDLFMLSAGNVNLWDAIVVIVHAEDYKFGIMADELLGQQQVVIKSLGKRFKSSKGISGAAIMGNGEVGLIADINGIKELAFNN